MNEKQKVIARPRDPQTGRFIIYDNEQEKWVKSLEEKLFAVCTALNLPLESSTLSTDDFNSNLRDAYDAAMRADAETLYAADIAERDRLKGEVASLEYRRASAVLAGRVLIVLTGVVTYLACKFLGVAK